jgi:hypothetical protein
MIYSPFARNTRAKGLQRYAKNVDYQIFLLNL